MLHLNQGLASASYLHELINNHFRLRQFLQAHEAAALLLGLSVLLSSDWQRKGSVCTSEWIIVGVKNRYSQTIFEQKFCIHIFELLKNRRMSTSYVIREVQMKMRPISMAEVQNTDTTKCWWGQGEASAHSLLVGMQNGTATLGDSVVASYKTTHALTIWSSNCTPWYLLTGVKNWCPHKNLHMGVYSSLFIIASTWKQTRRLLVGKWMNKLWFIQTIEYYSVPRRNELSSHDTTGSTLKCILLSERSPSEKVTRCMIPTIGHSGKGKIMEAVKRSVVARDSGDGRGWTGSAPDF